MIENMSIDEAMGDKWRPGVHYVEQAQVRISILAAEVRRLRDGIPPAMADFITAYRIRLLDEAAERVKKAILAEQKKHEEAMLGKWHTKEYSDGLQAGADIACAAVRGEVESSSEKTEREESLQEYLDRQDGQDIDLEHGSN